MIHLRRPWAEIIESANRLSASDADVCIETGRSLLSLAAEPDGSQWWIEPLGKNVPVGALLIHKQWAHATQADRSGATEAFVRWASRVPIEVVSIAAASLPTGKGRKALAEAVMAAIPDEVEYSDEARVERLTHLFRALLPDSAAVGVRNLSSPSATRRAVAVVVAPALRTADEIDRLGRLAMSGEGGEAPALATEHLGEVQHPRAMHWLKRIAASSKVRLPRGAEVALVRVQSKEALLLLLKAADTVKYQCWAAAIETSPGTAPRGQLPAPVLARLKRLLQSPVAGKREIATGIAVHWRLPDAIDLLKAAMAGKGGNDLRELAAGWARAWPDPRTTDLLLAALKSKNEEVRRIAILAMADRRVPEAIEPLRALAKKARHDEKAAIRAALAVIAKSDRAVVKALEMMPVGLSGIDRHPNAIAAVQEGNAAVVRRHLIFELNSADLGARAATALAGRSDVAAASLIAWAAESKGERHRDAFLAALWKLSELKEGGPDEVGSLQEICHRGPLVSHLPALLKEVKRRFMGGERRALTRLANSWGGSLSALAAELSGRYLVAAVLCLDRLSAHEEVAELAPATVEILRLMPTQTAVDLLAEASPGLRELVIGVLAERASAKRGEQEITDARALLDRLQPLSTHELSRRAAVGPHEASLKAIQALSEMRTPSAIAGLRDAATKHKNGYVRAEALTALARMGSPGVMPLLKRALRAKSHAERTYAAVALASLGNPDGQKALRKLLSKDWVRMDIHDLDPEETRPPQGLTQALKVFLESLSSGDGDLAENATFCLEVWAEEPSRLAGESEPAAPRSLPSLILLGPGGMRELWGFAEGGGLEES